MNRQDLEQHKQLRKEATQIVEAYKDDETVEYEVKTLIKYVLQLEAANARHVINHIENICKMCGHTKGEDGCPNCLKQTILTLEATIAVMRGALESIVSMHQYWIGGVDDTPRQKVDSHTATVAKAALSPSAPTEMLERVSAGLNHILNMLRPHVAELHSQKIISPECREAINTAKSLLELLPERKETK